MKQCDDCAYKDSGALCCAAYKARMSAQALLQELTNGILPKKIDDECSFYEKSENSCNL